jgi:HTH-type transcriptional regulator / antitoxin HigA
MQTLFKNITDMKIKIIKTEEEYNQALKRFEKIFDAKPGTKEGEELELLAMLIDNYEKQNDPIGLPDPIEAIKFRMEQLSYKPKDLAKIIGLPSRVTEILNRKRKLTLNMIRRINVQLHIPTDILVQEY